MNQRFKFLFYLFKLFIFMVFSIIKRWSKFKPWYYFLPFWDVEYLFFFSDQNIIIMSLHQTYWFQHSSLSRFKFLTPSSKLNLWVYIFNMTFFSLGILLQIDGAPLCFTNFINTWFALKLLLMELPFSICSCSITWYNCFLRLLVTILFSISPHFNSNMNKLLHLNKIFTVSYFV